MYQSKTHTKAIASLIIGIEYGVGFQVLIAPQGMGKTTILLHLLERLHNVACTAFLFQIHGDSRDLLHQLILELGGEADDSDLVRLQDTVNQLLIRELNAGRQTVIIIDEAQSFDASALEAIRLLSNFETPQQKLLQIILAGQPQLAQRLALPDVAQLHQRIPIRTTLTPLDPEETKNYIEHCLKIAGYSGSRLFTSAAVKSIWEWSRGVPREINTLCFNALLVASAAETNEIDSDILREVIADLDLDSPRFNADAAPTFTWGVPPLHVVPLENTLVAPPSTNPDKSCEVNGPVTAPESDAAVVPSTQPDRQDSIVAAVAIEHLPGCETGSVDSTNVSHFTSEAHDAPREGIVACGPRVRTFLPGSKGWVATMVALSILSSIAFVIGNRVKTYAQLLSLSRVTVPLQVKPTLPSDSVRGTTAVPPPADDPVGKLPNPEQEAKPEEDVASVAGSVQSSVHASGVIRQADLGSNSVVGQLNHTVRPIYPPAAQAAHLEGNVVVQAVVGTNGAVRTVRVVSGPPLLAQAAVDAVRHWHFRPSSLNGQPVESEMLVRVNFSLR